MKRFLSCSLLLIVAVFLPSCGHLPISNYQVVQVTSLDNDMLLKYLRSSPKGSHLRETATNEAVSRGLIRKSMSDLVISKTLSVGMTETEAKASWGGPHRKNYTKNGYSNREQWVYESMSSYQGDTYVYFVNGVLSVIQGSD